MTKSTPLDWHVPYLRKLASSCSTWPRSFFLFFLSFILVTNAQAQPESCEGKFSITATSSYDATLNKTTITFTVTETGNVNNLSHFGFPIELCPGTNLTVQQLLAGSTAQYSTVSATGPWSPANTAYGQDGSQNCVTGDLFKFDEGMPSNVTTMYFQLTINGNYSLIPGTAYVKYGNQCCVLNIANGGCTEEICLPITADAGADQTICAGSTATLTPSFGGTATSGSWSTSGTGSFSGNVYTPSAADITAGSVTLTYTTNNPEGPCPAVSDALLLTINPPATANAGADQTICAGSTATLTPSFGGSATSGSWSTSGTGSFSGNVYTPSAADITAGSVTLTYTTNNPEGPCPAVSDAMLLTIEQCGGEGCSPGFWKNHPELWDGLGDVTPGNMPAGLKFTTTTDFSTYFGVNPSGFDNSLTMLGAISQGGGGCKALARQGVAALLSLSAGADITFPTGTSDFTSLYNAIKAALTSGNCSGTLLTELEAISEGDHAPCDELKSRFRDTEPSITNRSNTGSSEVNVNMNVRAYPNPFSNRIQFTIESNISGRGTLVIYNMMGQKVKTVFEGHVSAGRGQVVEFKVPGLNRENLIYILTISGVQRTGKLINQSF
jgi:hypothetical protein